MDASFYIPFSSTESFSLSLEAVFATTAIAVNLIYARVFHQSPNFGSSQASCGAACPALSGRLMLLGNQP